MAFLSFSAALLYFDTPDELLHLYTPETIKNQFDESGVMHLPPNTGQRLIEVPFTRAAQPFFAFMHNRASSSTIQTQSEQKRERDNKNCTQVVQAFQRKPRQLQVLQALAEGLHPTQAAIKLGIKPSTINTHTGAIYDECRIAWEIPDKEQVNYRFVQAKFAHYFSNAASIASAEEKAIQHNSEGN
jgi:CRISPR-associated protein Csx14